MKVSLIIYRLVTFILLPIAGLNAFGLIGLLPVAISNPTMFLGLFIQFAIIAYTFSSYIFFSRGIQGGKTLKPALKDWIKVNAIVTIIFSIIVIVCCLAYLSSPDLQKAVSNNINNLPANLLSRPGGKANMLNQFKTLLLGGSVYAAILLTHTFITFRLLKQYALLFTPTNTQ